MSEPAHILIVDDDTELRETLRDVLEELGYVVSSAKDGKEALRQLLTAANRPNLILLDLQMPNMDGTEFRSEQLKVSELASIPVAILTADSEGKRKASAMHPAAYLEKPLKLLQLMTTIPRVIEPPAPESEKGQR